MRDGVCVARGSVCVARWEYTSINHPSLLTRAASRRVDSFDQGSPCSHAHSRLSRSRWASQSRCRRVGRTLVFGSSRVVRRCAQRTAQFEWLLTRFELQRDVGACGRSIASRSQPTVPQQIASLCTTYFDNRPAGDLGRYGQRREPQPRARGRIPAVQGPPATNVAALEKRRLLVVDCSSVILTRVTRIPSPRRTGEIHWISESGARVGYSRWFCGGILMMLGRVLSPTD